MIVKIVGYIISFLIFLLAVKELKLYYKRKKLLKNWRKIKKAYPKDDFATIKKAIKKIRAIEDDPLLLLLEAQMYFEGHSVFKNPARTMELLKQIDAIPLPAKSYLEKNEYTKKYSEKLYKKKLKKEKYLKKIKAKAREMWNENEFWELDYKYKFLERDQKKD
jgi:hypothetical protein